MSASVFDQFEVNKILDLSLTDKLDVSITNATVFLIIAMGIYWALYTQSGLSEAKIIPGRIQAIVESIYEVVRGIVVDNIANINKANKYIAMIMALFALILTLNLMGLVPYTFSPTAQVAVSLGLSLSI
jgi:F-type H+-transporting ATPase subunit a